MKDGGHITFNTVDKTWSVAAGLVETTDAVDGPAAGLEAVEMPRDHATYHMSNSALEIAASPAISASGG